MFFLNFLLYSPGSYRSELEKKGGPCVQIRCLDIPDTNRIKKGRGSNHDKIDIRQKKFCFSVSANSYHKIPKIKKRQHKNRSF